MSSNLNNYTVPELKQEARNQGLAGYSSLPRTGLINLIRGIFSPRAPATPAPRAPVMADLSQSPLQKEGFMYTISDKGEGHTIEYVTSIRSQEPYISESVRAYGPNYQQYSVLRKLYGEKAMPTNSSGRRTDGPNYGIDNPTAEEIREVLNELRELPNYDEAQLISTRTNQRLNEPEVFPFSANEDLLYELSKHLTAQQLRNLCSSNSEYRKICQTERFQQLVQNLRQPIEEFNRLLTGFQYIISDKGEGHTIEYLSPGERYNANISESVRGYPGDYRKHSILRRLYGRESMPSNTHGGNGGKTDGPNYGISNPTRAQIKEVLNELKKLPDYDPAKLTLTMI